ncbi:MAG: GTP-binding protein [Candidatus Helarchaeota archaeon]
MKILVTGPFHAGKSSFVRKATEMFGVENPAISIDKNETTVALDLGVLKIKGLKIFLFGTPGHLRFYSVRKILSYGADGIIFIVDPVSDLNITDVLRIWDEISDYVPNIPKVIAVSKQDLPEDERRSIDELKQYFPFMKEYKVFPTSAITGENIEKAILSIVVSVIDKLKDTLRVFFEFQGEVQGIQKVAFKMNKSIYETKKYLRWLERRNLADVDWRLSMFWLCDGIEKILISEV